MIAFLSRFIRRFCAREPKWIDTAELQRRLAAGDRVTLVDVRQPEDFSAQPDICRVPSMCRSPIFPAQR